MDYQDKDQIAIAIINRVTALRKRHVLTSAGEVMSQAAIGRTCEPPVTRMAVSLVANGHADTERIRRAIERELGESYWKRGAQETEKRRGAVGSKEASL